MTDQIPLPIDEELYGRAFSQLDGPIHWPSLTADARTVRSNELGDWVEKLVARFDIDVLRDPPHPRHGTATSPASTGTSCPRTSNPSIRRQPSRLQPPRWTPWRTSGAPGARR